MCEILYCAMNNWSKTMYVRAFQQYHHIPSLPKVLRVILSFDTFDNLHIHSISAFQNFFRIENWLNIKKVMSKNVCVCSFDTFDIDSITTLIYFELLLTPLTYIAFDLLFVAQYSTHVSWHLWHLQHQTKTKIIDTLKTLKNAFISHKTC